MAQRVAPRAAAAAKTRKRDAVKIWIISQQIPASVRSKGAEQDEASEILRF